MGQLLCPIERTPVVICVGLNYKKHAEEAAVRFSPRQTGGRNSPLGITATNPYRVLTSSPYPSIPLSS